MKVKDIVKITNGKILCGDEGTHCNHFVRDSREVKEGDVYIALKGERFDGNDFCQSAIENGAKVCIVSRDVREKKNDTKLDNTEADKINNSIKENNVTIIQVPDTLKAMQEIATYKRMQYNIPVVAVTGSVGKTSTKDLIASVVSQKYNTLKTQGNYNNEIGLPLTILGLTNEEAMVVEMGMNHFGEIRKLTNIAKPTVAVITNIGTAHIGNLGSRENILKAKLEILEGLQGNTVVINNDNDLLYKWASENKDKYNIITYGIKNKSKYMATEIMPYADKSEFKVICEKDERISDSKQYVNMNPKQDRDRALKQDINRAEEEDINNKKIIVPVGGEHFILNSLCAIAVGEYLNVPTEKIINGIANLELTKKRMEVLTSKAGATVINDTYNANYDSMKAAITYLKEIKNKRKIAVLGDMLELGDYSKELHEKVGEEVDESIDILITIGKEAKHIAEKSKAKQIIECKDNEEAIEKLKEIQTKDDAILLKASNGMKFFEIATALCE